MIYRTGRRLYSDISPEERAKDKKETIQALSVLVPLFIASFVFAIYTGFELVGLLAFFFFMVASTVIIPYLSKTKLTLDKYSRLKITDPELYQLEYAESMKMAERFTAKNNVTPSSNLTTHICISDSNDIPLKQAGQTYGNDILLRPSSSTSTQAAPPQNLNPAKTATSTSHIFCRKCGEKLPGDSIFCTKCGEKILR